jgi:hypothetical protein
MIYSTATVPVNPEGETKLTREQVWKGLELKARDACLFLPPGLCTHCDVIEESATHFVREATIAGSDIREIITLAGSTNPLPMAYGTQRASTFAMGHEISSFRVFSQGRFRSG